MQMRRGLRLPTTLLLIGLTSVSKATFWDGILSNGDQQNDQERIKYDASDGYGVDIVRILFACGGLY